MSSYLHFINFPSYSNTSEAPQEGPLWLARAWFSLMSGPCCSLPKFLPTGVVYLFVLGAVFASIWTLGACRPQDVVHKNRFFFPASSLRKTCWHTAGLRLWVSLAWSWTWMIKVSCSCLISLQGVLYITAIEPIHLTCFDTGMWSEPLCLECALVANIIDSTGIQSANCLVLHFPSLSL